MNTFKDWRTWAMIGAVALAVIIARDWFYSNPILTGQSTAYDYMTASMDRAIEWDAAMCNGGVCLLESDWKCGFWPENNTPETGDQDWGEAVRECFATLVRNVQGYERLHKLRQICGRRYMTFKGKTLAASEDECKKARGLWGKKKSAWLDEDDQIYKDK